MKKIHKMFQARLTIILVTITCGVMIESLNVAKPAMNYDQKCPSLRLKNGQVRLRSRNRIVRFNCMRTYQLVGVKYATCIGGQWDAEVPICVKPGCPKTSSSNVNGLFLESYRGAVVKVVCNPGYTLIGPPSVYCNGVIWNDTFPMCKVLNKNPEKACDFEKSDICGWSQDDVGWKRLKGSMSTPSESTTEVNIGPILDHNNNSGNYMYVVNRVTSETTKLYSPVYNPDLSIGSCFSFWYYMDGSSVGTLKAYVKLEGIELDQLIPPFWINGQQGRFWNRGFFMIEETKSPFQIVFEGTRGIVDGSIIAVDDVNLGQGDECILKTTTAETLTTASDVDEDDGDDPLSCKERCNEEPVFDGTLITPEKIMERPNCDCHTGCVRNNTCCSDYMEYCGVMAGVTSSLNASIEIKVSSTTNPSLTSSSSSPLIQAQIPLPSKPIKTKNESDVSDSSNSVALAGKNQSAKNVTINDRDLNGTKTNLSQNATVSKPEIRPFAESYDRTTKKSISNNESNEILKTMQKPNFRNVSNAAKTNNATVQREGKNKTNVNNLANATFSGKVLEKNNTNFNLTATLKPPFENVSGNFKKTKSVSVNSDIFDKTTKTTLTKTTIPLLKPTTINSVYKSLKTNENKFPLMVNPSKQILDSRPRFQKGNSLEDKEIGNELPQAMKSGGETSQPDVPLINVLGPSAALFALLSFIAITAATIIIRRRKKKTERENMIEDSDSILFGANPLYQPCTTSQSSLQQLGDLRNETI